MCAIRAPGRTREGERERDKERVSERDRDKEIKSEIEIKRRSKIDLPFFAYFWVWDARVQYFSPDLVVMWFVRYIFFAARDTEFITLHTVLCSVSTPSRP
eukprot:sb/3478602/